MAAAVVKSKSDAAAGLFVGALFAALCALVVSSADCGCTAAVRDGTVPTPCDPGQLGGLRGACGPLDFWPMPDAGLPPLPKKPPRRNIWAEAGGD